MPRELRGYLPICALGNRHIDLSPGCRPHSGPWTGTSHSFIGPWKTVLDNHTWKGSFHGSPWVQQLWREVPAHCWGKKWVWIHWRSWKEQFNFTCVISLLSQQGLVPRQTFSACDFSHGGMWDHVSICSASPAVWDATKEAYFSFTATREESLIWWLQEEGRKKLAEQQIELSENIKREQILLTTLKTPLRSLTMKHWRNLNCWSPLKKYSHFEHSTSHVYTIPQPVATSFCGQFPVCMCECGKWKLIRRLVSTYRKMAQMCELQRDHKLQNYHHPWESKGEMSALSLIHRKIKRKNF